MLGQSRADGDAIASHVIEGAAKHGVAEQWLGLKVLCPHATHDNPTGSTTQSNQRLSFNDGKYVVNTINLPGKTGQIVIIGHRPGIAADIGMAVQPQHPVEQLVPKAVHDAHHHNQGSYPKGNAEQRENRDDRDEAFLAACAQIAKRQ